MATSASFGSCARAALRVSTRGLEQMPQDDVHKAGALRADLASAAAAVVLQPEAMVFDLEELFVERKQLRGIQLALGSEAAVRRARALFRDGEAMSAARRCRHLAKAPGKMDAKARGRQKARDPSQSSMPKRFILL